jgi:hypothetical protein
MFSDQENNRELSEEEKERYFNLDLNNSANDEQDMYHTLLGKVRAKRARQLKGKPPTIGLNEREELLRRAKVLAKGAHFHGVDPIKQEEAWDKATYKGRPPIGGAKDD